VALLDNLPHLISLKIIGDSTDLWGMDYPFLRTLRLSSFPPYDPSALSRLTRLFVRCGLGQPTDFAMRKIHKLCPGIVEVHLVPFNGGSFDISYYFEKRFDFRMELDQDEGWKLYDKVGIALLTLFSASPADAKCYTSPMFSKSYITSAPCKSSIWWSKSF
jgi:hypothetical protein